MLQTLKINSKKRKKICVSEEIKFDKIDSSSLCMHLQTHVLCFQSAYVALSQLTKVLGIKHDAVLKTHA